MKSDVAIKVEGLSKQYRLGVVGTGTISHDLNRWWAQLRGKEDPYLKIGETNDRSQKGTSDYVWSLKDIDFEVKQGEVLGVIGKNGAGKSTLLKILSKVTGPTTGRIMAKGRIGALLEVGTGFHPELTGRENVFLNGAILGMTKMEIKSKLDEIIDFSGCERYIDTPAKRYSSGMTVRLAFAVAAFLEPEILIVDEVLAVGDAEFQKKAIGKMQDVSKGEGRTVLFVSHNMGAVESLCTKCLVLKNGQNSFLGDVPEGVKHYLSNKESKKDLVSRYVEKISLTSLNGVAQDAFFMGEGFNIEILVHGLDVFQGIHVGVFIMDTLNQKVTSFSTAMSKGSSSKHFERELITFSFPNQNLIPSSYVIDISISYKSGGRIEYVADALSFDIIASDIYGTGSYLNTHFGKFFLNGLAKVIEVPQEV
ncbi:lipopolysaccharide transport system ATP-binding protein [Roseivirga ehrenbergii]|uniref:ABC transporter domain-containing protein n=1 Tax=Roseivirga ehrenbergii (strain DSM 102268 / JCM 13514 / KCTC 12282 / NCIMB 14502 / KMM 6017) TaxID=279360 RepID=A0A150XEC0_ROSEK|nr:ABC transporter ATP-binding protein [Roseivirga ehrenbergii]KYG77036.1 hypothetical protein MB14_02205 [Roseivirga ehrenbergii]TCL14463.1 lipopolysaccharide transport system ATP-binding protein [Roseivirga ehrenbergii]